MDVSLLPAVNASLNATAAALLTAGYVAIRQKRIDVHRRFMLGAFAASVLFLACYLTYHTLRVRATGEAHTKFPEVGAVRGFYLVLLVSHLVLAVPVVPLALVTLTRGLRGRIESHRRMARWTLPIWIYVSVTGVMVYIMLYHVAPRLAAAG